ncbi:unnamed protein product [Polarella glacialis]|nr:unnamed protein product [Polarella glacialis]
MDLDTTLDSLLMRYAGGATGSSSGELDPEAQLLVTEDSQMLNTAIFLARRSAWSLDMLRRVWGGAGPGEEEDATSPFVNHTWWEQAAFAQELLGENHRRFADVVYSPDGVSGAEFLKSGVSSAYPPEVRLVPQAEMNSYHPISSRLVGNTTWSPGKFILSFNGVQSLTGPTVARILVANYYEVFCKLNSVEHLCQGVLSEEGEMKLFAPWLSQP